METITIPKQLTKRGELVIISRDQYETLVEIAEKKSFDANLVKSLADYSAGRYYGPFQTIEQGKKFLRSRSSGRKR